MQTNETPQLAPPWFLGSPGREIPSTTGIKFVSDLHANLFDDTHIATFETISRGFNDSHIIWGGDTINLDLPHPNSQVLEAFAHIAGANLKSQTVLGGNHDPRTLLEYLFKQRDSAAQVFSHTFVQREEANPVLFMHGDRINPLNVLGGLSFWKKASHRFGHVIDNAINGNRTARVLAVIPQLIQTFTYRRFLASQTDAVVGHTHWPTVKVFPNGRRLIISGCGYGDTLNGADGELYFHAVDVPPKGALAFEKWRVDEQIHDIELIDRNEI